jgi:hypothetical protein
MIDEPQAEASKPIILGGPGTPGPVHEPEPEPAPVHEPVVPPERPPEPDPEPGPDAVHEPVHEPVPPPERPVPPAPPPPGGYASAPYPAPPPARRGVFMPLLGLLGFVVLACAIAYLWVRPAPNAATPAMPPDESGAVATLQSDVATLKTQVAGLDARETADVAALHRAIAAIPPPAPASAPAPAAPPAPAPAPAVASAAPDTALAPQLAALSARLTQLQAVESAQAQQTQTLPSAADVSNLATRVDAIAQRESKDGDAVRQDLTLVQQQLVGVTSQTQSVAKATNALPQLTAEADRLAQLVRAEAALNAGLPLGSIDNAPPALARFADTAPPTEAALRLSFPAAAKAADKASSPQPAQGRFWHRVLVRVEDLVTLRQGDHVIMGDETAGILAHAQETLDAGDLAGTLAVLGTLSGPAATVMAPWEAQARAVLDAREALAKMAAG